MKAGTYPQCFRCLRVLVVLHSTQFAAAGQRVDLVWSCQDKLATGKRALRARGNVLLESRVLLQSGQKHEASCAAGSATPSQGNAQSTRVQQIFQVLPASAHCHPHVTPSASNPLPTITRTVPSKGPSCTQVPAPIRTDPRVTKPG